ncbi:MAG: Holliday junction resolvase RuvX [Lachnospiraceae bacterium]|nr:Holliday junction resolvase RuvX [Lachnospiraceae bacterium]
MSSAEAEERMRAAGIGSREQKELVDQVAASVILEDYLGGI